MDLGRSLLFTLGHQFELVIVEYANHRVFEWAVLVQSFFAFPLSSKMATIIEARNNRDSLHCAAQSESRAERIKYCDKVEVRKVERREERKVHPCQGVRADD